MRNLARTTLLLTSLAPMLCLAQTGHPSAGYLRPDHPRDGEIHNADTLGWWHTTEALSNDGMEGRDTGTAAYQRAADYVAARFRAAGLAPAGDNVTYFQNVPMHQVDVTPAGTSFTVLDKSGHHSLGFLGEITITASASLPRQLEAPLTFRGYCGKEVMADVAGKIVVCFGTQRQGLPSGGERLANARNGGAAGLINVDDPYFSIEPPRWPYAYARTVTLAGPVRREGSTLPVMRISAEAFTKLLKSSGHGDQDAVLQLGGEKRPLPSFELDSRLRITTQITEKDISSPNVLAVLPGADPTLAAEYVVASAHLDGYGFGTAVNGDKLYNGTLDDAAYVALLIQMADDLHAGLMKKGHIQQAGYKRDGPGDVVDTGVTLGQPKRSILFCAFTGEEKGLLGSNWFVQHPTVPLVQLAADVNLDQLRPLFPLSILTAEAVNDATLGETARSVATPMKVEIRTDSEPERGLLRRADQFPFLAAHVPAISFIFGYDPGTDAERRYREWYQVRYHRPQDDLTQPINFDAAVRFNTFFYRLVETIANDTKRPAILPGSQFAAKP
jgi:hypothetical protein